MSNLAQDLFAILRNAVDTECGNWDMDAEDGEGDDYPPQWLRDADNLVNTHRESAFDCAHVIKCNNMVVCVVLGSEEDAKGRMEVEQQAHRTKAAKLIVAYNIYYIWSIHTVPLY